MSEMIKEYYHQRNLYKIGGARLRHILDLLPQSSGEVLDVGCGSGDLAQILSEKEYIVDGIDISHQSIHEAKKSLREGFVCDISQELPKEIQTRRYDCIIVSEVLEHIFAPDKALTRLLQHLKPGGRIIVTVPNFLFWKIRYRVLFGNFRYENEGLLDFGHIRFFTYSYANELFDKLGLRIEREHHFYPNFYRRGIMFLGKKFPSLFAYQFIYVLMKKDKSL